MLDRPQWSEHGSVREDQAVEVESSHPGKFQSSTPTLEVEALIPTNHEPEGEGPAFVGKSVQRRGRGGHNQDVEAALCQALAQMDEAPIQAAVTCIVGHDG